MATVSAGALLSAIPLSLDSLHSPKFASRSLSNWCLKPLPPTFATNFSFKSRNIAFNESRFLVKATAEDLSADVGEVLGDVSIFTPAGEPVLFKDLWDQTQGVAVVALLRHFGCPFCWELALALKEAKATFDLAGVKLIAVGVGSPNKAQILAERVYNLLGLSYGISRTFFNPAKVLTRFGALQKAVENYTIKGTLDDIRGIFQQGVAVVALLRHFGCPCCWELASALKEAKATFDSASVKLIAVGVGSPNKAQILAERLPFPMDCLYADPDRKAYNLLGLYFGIGRTFFNPASAKVFSRLGALQKAVENYTIEATPDDRSGVLQQGGMFVFKGRDLLYAWRDEGTGDHAPLDDIFRICCKVPAS
ncbi:uncharacterized protein LOC123199471 [Mangifera indica]|uniref:uncharacterized protein LOC123199471 n=1 Tax=Mangifera indica TaxID=29780 RepID=UPI001CF9ED13|nr:uncharacterized protein LOC123199471 [Mangifera indica]